MLPPKKITELLRCGEREAGPVFFLGFPSVLLLLAPLCSAPPELLEPPGPEDSAVQAELVLGFPQVTLLCHCSTVLGFCLPKFCCHCFFSCPPVFILKKKSHPFWFLW